MRSFKRCNSEQATLRLLDVEEREIYCRTKLSFERTFFVEMFRLENITEQEALTICRDRIVDETAHYLTFSGPLHPIDKLGKAYDIWLDTTPDEEAMYYKRGSGCWAHWDVAADTSFSDIEQEPRHLTFLSDKQFSTVGWFVMTAHRPLARTALNENDMVRLSYLRSTVRDAVFRKKLPPSLWSSLDQQLNRMRNDYLQPYVEVALHTICKSDIEVNVQINAFPPGVSFSIRAWTDGRRLYAADHEASYGLTVVSHSSHRAMKLVRFRRGNKNSPESWQRLFTYLLNHQTQLEYFLSSDADEQSATLHLFPSKYVKLAWRTVHIMIQFETTHPSSTVGKRLRTFFETILPLSPLKHPPKRLCLDPLWKTMCQSAVDTQRKDAHLARVYEKRLNDELEPQEHDDEEDSPRPFGNRVHKSHSDSEYAPSDEDDSTPSSQRRKRYPLRHFRAIVLDSDSGSDSGDDRDNVAPIVNQVSRGKTASRPEDVAKRNFRSNKALQSTLRPNNSHGENPSHVTSEPTSARTRCASGSPESPDCSSFDDSSPTSSVQPHFPENSRMNTEVPRPHPKSPSLTCEIAASRGQVNAPTRDNSRASSRTPTPLNASSTRPSLSIIRAMKPRLSASETNLAKQAAQENDKDQSNRNQQDLDESLKSLGGQATLSVSTEAHNQPLVAEVVKLDDDREHNGETSRGQNRGDDIGPGYDLVMENQRPVDGDRRLPGLDVDRKPNVQEPDERHLLSAVSLQGSGSIDQPIVIVDDDDEDLSPPSDLGGSLDINTPKSAPSVGGALGYTKRSLLVEDSTYVEPIPGARPGTIAESNQEPLTMASSLVNPSDLETSVQSNRPDMTKGNAPKHPNLGCGPSSCPVKIEGLAEENSGTLLVPARRMEIDTSLEDARSSRPDKRQLASSNSEEGDDVEDIRPSKRSRPSLQQPLSKSGTSETTDKDPLITIYLEDERFDIQKSKFLRHSDSFSQVFIPDGEFGTGASTSVGPWRLLSENSVRATAISAADFRSLLEALDDIYDFMFDTPAFPKLASILRASTVLGFTKVTRFVVNCLEHMWPSDLSRLSHTRIPYAIETIEIARKNDIPQIRKRAFYEVIKAASDASIQDDIFGNMQSDKDRLLVYRAQAIFQKEWMMIAKAAPHTQCDKTQSAGSSSCCVQRDIRVQHWSVLVTESPVYDDGVQDIFYGLDRLSCLDWSTQGWCTVCTEDWRRLLEQKRMTLWSDLDRYVQQG